MALTAGTKLGPYEIQSPLGAGGMGEVYRALDTRLDRTVAVKILAGHLSSSPELKQRMEREARAISSLNHPHICQLYDIGSQNGTDYLVMEFLQGETLAERLRRGALPLNEVLKIGVDVAEALAVAHRQGIVHRDLKPGNIMLTQGGAKLMDFGLAKPLGPANANVASGSIPSFTAVATMSGPSPLSPLTSAGSIVGTIQYMSPEQIEGKEADARSDIFAFGAVLYEMTTGKRPFSGKSQISLASSILEKDPDPISATNPLTPAAFEHVLTTCLQKNPEDRFLAAHDVKLELQWIAAGKSAPAVAAASAAPANPRERYGWIAAVVVAIVLGAAAGIFIHRPTQSALDVRTVVDPPDKATLNLTGDFSGPPVLSPDGTALAFTANGADGKTEVWVRPMNTLDAHSLPGTDGATFPFWAPDGRALGFFADSKLKTVELNGGAPATICDALSGRGGTWGPDGVILFTPGTQKEILRVAASGGTPVPVTQLDPAHTSHRWPSFLPDGKHFLYLAINHDPAHADNDAVYYASLDGRENRELFRSQSNAVYGSGFILFARSGQLMAQPFDPDSGKISGEPQTLAGGVVDDVSTWHMDASASNHGLLVLASGGSADWQLFWSDRNGKQLGPTVVDNITNLIGVRISPQGDRVVLTIDNGVTDLWVFDLARATRTRLTFGPVSNASPVWSPDGKWIAYDSARNGHYQLYRKPADGSGAEELLLDDEQVVAPTDWSQDGKYLIYTRGAIFNDAEIWALPLEGERKPWLVVPRLANSFTAGGRLSPDGRWLAYMSTESGTPQVYVVAFRGGQGKWQVSTNEGSKAKWRRDGKELYFANDNSRVLSAVSVTEVNGALQFGTAQALVTTPATRQFIYDVAPDGKKVLLNVVAQQVNQSITVIANFTAGLKK
jgi:eukaryotic-like serine/threonine-protein kinase